MAWAIYDHKNELIDLQGICLGHTTNNIVEYIAVIEMLSEAISLTLESSLST